MITVSKNENSVLFEFSDSTQYLYGDGKIEVPVNSLSVIADESKMITLRKAASHDIFISAAYTDFGYSSKEAAVEGLKALLFGETGGADPEEIEAIVESALTPVYADISSIQDEIDDIQDDIDEKEEVVATALNELKDADDVTAAALAQLNGGLYMLSQNVDTTQADVADIQADVADVQADVADVQADVADVQADVADVQADIADVQANMGGIKLQKIYESDYEALSEKDGNTLYVILPDVPFDEQYFTIKSLEDNNRIGWNSVLSRTITVSTDNGVTWNEYQSTNSNSGTTLAVLNTGDKILFKSNGIAGANNNNGPKIVADGRFNVFGNIMSLEWADDFIGKTSLRSGYNTFSRLLQETGVVSAENLIIPATNAGWLGYSGMFRNCTSLTTAPELPATTLAQSCYSGMFDGCTSLTTAPELPATTLANSCYSGMFDGCSSLTTAPVLPATTLAQKCYSHMFSGCTSLTTAPELPATTLASECYSSMFDGCSSLTTAPELPATTLANNCYSHMFSGCASLTTAPELPATALAEGCYWYMFSGCKSLTTAPELPATTLVDSCYQEMFRYCKNLNYIKMLATDISASNCLSGWVESVASTGTFVKNAAMTTLPTGANGIPSGWTVEDAA